MNYEPVIGLEVHVQLKTDSKIFCSCSTKFGASPNSQVCPVCLGMPGVLPVLNEKVVEFATRLALATNAKINKRSILARKNYFYPDLPKAYQISQFEEPFCENGYLEIETDDGSKKIGITRIHMEEDAGKSLHAESFVSKNESLVDINRCGVPLLEIVSEPDFRSPQEAYDYLVKLRQIVVYLDVCDGNMEEGSLRCDANVSIRPINQTALGIKTELKNMNSFRAVEKALEYEIHRQEMVLDNGGTIQQLTLLWDANRNIAEPMRSKEYSHDYRYFPDPDLVPIAISEEYINSVSEKMPELPGKKQRRFVEEFGLPQYDAHILTDNPQLASYFENVAHKVEDKKQASNWIMGPILRALKEKGGDLNQLKVTAEYLAEIIQLVEKQTINYQSAKSVFDECLQSGIEPNILVKQKGLVQISDFDEIDGVLDKVISENSKDVDAFLAGKDKIFGFLMGQAMKATRGKANPKIVKELLEKKLENLR